MKILNVCYYIISIIKIIYRLSLVCNTHVSVCTPTHKVHIQTYVLVQSPVTSTDPASMASFVCLFVCFAMVSSLYRKSRDYDGVGNIADY